MSRTSRTVFSRIRSHKLRRHWSGVGMLQAMVVLILGITSAARGQAPAAPDELALTTSLVIEGIGGGGRTLIQTDAVEALRVTGAWKTPGEGDEVTLADGSKKTWTKKDAGDDGWLSVRPGGYAFWSVESATERVMILEASGHAMAMVNGEPRVGDPYEMGYVKLPVLLKTGVNEILLKSGRGRVRGKLVAPPAGVFLNLGDTTMPDLLVDGQETPFGAVIVVNATREPLVGATLETRAEDKVATTPVPTIPALTTRKVRVNLLAPGVTETGEKEFRIAVVLPSDSNYRAEGPATIKVGVRHSTDKHKRTFVSDIDGSVQYYSVVPPPEGTDLSTPKALILSLHGASVEAAGQANCYKQRDWCYVVCPTNRRPYGFDWEDWGRTDALEVLAEARQRFKLDERRTYLTGHSMGGHGTWNLGVQFPGTFAAIGPSAGWISFWSYAGGANRENVSDVEKILLRATCMSDTLAMKQNFAQQGVYILHGDADDNVPVAQARQMREELGKFHPDFAYHEQPGAGHWWGDQCVDWDPMIEFFKRHVRPEEKDVRKVEFTTVTPGSCHWVTIEQQVKQFEASRVEISVEADNKTFEAKTQNVARLALLLEPFGYGSETLSIEIDGQKLENIAWPQLKGASILWLERGEKEWRTISVTRSDRVKNTSRPGLFKNAFGGDVMLVYSTKGTPEENAWSMRRARYDAEVFWYRGNGSISVVADDDLDDAILYHTPGEPPSAPDPWARSHRNVILYGNSETNAAWKAVLGDCPVRVSRLGIGVGSKQIEGENLAVIFLRPREGDPQAYVGVVAGTGLAGMKLTDRLPYFVSGVGVPDWVVFSPELLTKGAAGVKGAGFFGNDWTVEGGEAVWAE